MSDLKSMDDGFSEIIPNPAGCALQKDDSLNVQKEHIRWKKEVRQIKQEKSIKGQSYWKVVSSCVAL